MSHDIASRPRTASRRSVLGLAAAGLGALFAVSGRAAAASDPERPASGTGSDGDAGIREGVAGELVNRSGAPIAGALIAAAADGRGAGPVPELAVQTDARGRFRWPLGPGRYRLDAIADGRTIATLRVMVPPGRVARARLTAADER